MGAINYGSNNNFIDIGYNLKNYDHEEDFYLCEDCYDQVKIALNKLNFVCLSVKVIGGYYEGFYLEIDINYSYFDNYQEKQKAIKEATQLRKFLEECINDYDCVVYHAGWCSVYESKKDSLLMLKQAIKELNAKIKAMKTDKTLSIDEWHRLVGITQ